jgi:hypothetical protein
MKEWHLGNKTKEIQGASRGTPLGIGGNNLTRNMSMVRNQEAEV